MCREVDSLRFETATVRALELQSTNSPFIPVGIFLHHYPPASSFLSHPTHRLVGVARSALRSLRKARRTHLQSEAGRFFRKATAAVEACLTGHSALFVGGGQWRSICVGVKLRWVHIIFTLHTSRFSRHYQSKSTE